MSARKPKGYLQLEIAFQRRLRELSEISASEDATSVGLLQDQLDSMVGVIGSILESDKWRKGILAIMFHNSLLTFISAFYSIEWRPAFGHLAFILLGHFNYNRRSLEIRLKCSRLLRMLTDVSYRDDSLEALSAILPGVYARCHDVALENANIATSLQIPLDALEVCATSSIRDLVH